MIEGSPHCQKYLCVTFAESNKGEVAPSTKMIVFIHGVGGRYCCLLRDLFVTVSRYGFPAVAGVAAVTHLSQVCVTAERFCGAVLGLSSRLSRLSRCLANAAPIIGVGAD